MFLQEGDATYSRRLNGNYLPRVNVTKYIEFISGHKKLRRDTFNAIYMRSYMVC